MWAFSIGRQTMTKPSFLGSQALWDAPTISHVPSAQENMSLAKGSHMFASRPKKSGYQQQLNPELVQLGLLNVVGTTMIITSIRSQKSGYDPNRGEI